MMTYQGSLLYQLIGKRITVLSTGETGLISKIEISKTSSNATFTLLNYVEGSAPLYEKKYKIIKVKLSLIQLLRSVKLHSL